MNGTGNNEGLKLEGESIELELLEPGHKSQLASLLNNEAIWEFTWRKVTELAQAEALVDEALQARANGTQLPFAVIDKKSGRIVGTTRIAEMNRTHRIAEVGYSWLSPAVWRTKVNTECKRLLLAYCFEQLNVQRVQFSVSHFNIRSQRAVERIGAVKEGVLRRARVKPDGSIHDVVIYAILDNEWPAVQDSLDGLLRKTYR
ncbi:RimJ/RimL family protein N-acetyltransferase [Paenibacillus phyllosphaerae]|uniref:RimJ/RimL family protein N-acetyltransferase n=1 Tax=Paenibacillus phyllosphaerae TaxID=274593 RepID=A0A7W5AZF8_9BACL|nr:GNAT family protein [Paenibacillus phyllosphaerae]MBB3111605.1 RimJ/RimL family protein N-acetyltransferase [Paenibacillus phyllosphaerae]